MSDKQDTAPATWIYALHRTLLDEGFDADAIFKSAGLEFSSIKSTTQKICRKLANGVWRKAEEVTNDDAFCIKTFSHLNDSHLNALITSVQSSSSIQQALKLLLRYYHMFTTGLKLRVEINEDLELHVETKKEGKTAYPQDVDFVFGLVTKYGSVIPAEEISPSRVYMTRPKPKNYIAYQEYFGCEIIFESEQNALHFPAHILDAEIPSANPALSQHVEKYLADQVKTIDHTSIKDAVDAALVELIPNGTPKLKHVADRLNMSERTLQRKLQHEQISFSDLLSEVRIRLAHQYLKSSDQSIQNIAYQLGFTEPGNFIRFFKQHTGQTPNAFAKSSTV